MKKKRRRSLKRQIITGCVIFIALLCLIMSIVNFELYRNSMLSNLQSQITSILTMTAAQIDADDLEVCVDTGEKSPKFIELTQFVDDERMYYGLDYLVLVQPIKLEDSYDSKMIVSGLLPDERAGLVDNGIPIPALSELIGAGFTQEFLEMAYNEMMTSNDIHFSSTKNDYGDSYGGSISLRNSKGEGIALISAGISTASFTATMQHYILLTVLCAVILGVSIMIFIIIWARKRILKPIETIENTAKEFAKKSHGQKDPSALVLNMPEIKSGNELEDLADTLGSMSQDMKAYVEDIVYSEKEILRIRGIALNDALTGVRNKTAFNSEEGELDKEIEAGTAEFGILMIDLNSLKTINDNYGHEKGDIYIKHSCTIICDVFDHCPVFRIGGDEFAVILKGSCLHSADELVERFNKEMQASHEDTSLEEWERVWAAVGLAVFDSSIDTNVADVLSRADRKMYDKKRKMKSAEKR